MYKHLPVFKRLMVILLAGMLMTGFAGCKEEGHAEKVGKKLDKAVDDAKDKLNDLRK